MCEKCAARFGDLDHALIVAMQKNLPEFLGLMDKIRKDANEIKIARRFEIAGPDAEQVPNRENVERLMMAVYLTSFLCQTYSTEETEDLLEDIMQDVSGHGMADGHIYTVGKTFQGKVN